MLACIIGGIIALTGALMLLDSTSIIPNTIESMVSIVLIGLGAIVIMIDTEVEKMKEYTLIYKAEITEILNEEEMALVPTKDGKIDVQALAGLAEEMLDVDDVVISKVKVFELDKVEE